MTPKLHPLLSLLGVTVISLTAIAVAQSTTTWRQQLLLRLINPKKIRCWGRLRNLGDVAAGLAVWIFNECM